MSLPLILINTSYFFGSSAEGVTADEEEEAISITSSFQIMQKHVVAERIIVNIMTLYQSTVN